MTHAEGLLSEFTDHQRVTLRAILQSREGLHEICRTLYVNPAFLIRNLSEAAAPAPHVAFCSPAAVTLVEEEPVPIGDAADVQRTAAAFIRRQRLESGYGLIELMICMAITAVLLAVAVPNAVTMNRIATERSARSYARERAAVMTADTVCHAEGGQCWLLDAQLPANRTVGGYSFTFQPPDPDTGAWSYQGVPVTALPGLRTVLINQTGVMTCNGSPCN